jgi:mono/diheme cytochrome c family protein
MGRLHQRVLGAAASLAAVALAALPAFAADRFSPDLVEQGRYLATAGDCAACHTKPDGGQPYAGGYAIDSPLGAIYASNITPSAAGIGGYSEGQFAKAVRQGIRADGAHLYPAMPYTAYAQLSDADVHALYAYFMQGVAPVEAKAEQTKLPFPFNLRFSMAFWNGLFLKDKRFQADPAHDAQWNRGAYLVNALEHCSSCHSPRGLLMQEKTSKAFSGGAVGPWYAPNITSDPISGIGGWSRQELVAYMRSGAVQGKNQAAGGMAEAVEHSLQHLTSSDLEAMAVYLKTVPAVRDRNEDKPAFSHGAPANFEPDLRGVPAGSPPDGAALYSAYCASCHGVSGAGSKDQAYPSLFHNTATGATRPDNLVATILNGVDRKVGERHVFMPRFDQTSYVQPLSDAQIAALGSYVFKTFGNPKVSVSARDVALARQGGPPSFLGQAAKLIVPGGAALLVVLALTWLALRRRRTLTGKAL